MHMQSITSASGLIIAVGDGVAQHHRAELGSPLTYRLPGPSALGAVHAHDDQALAVGEGGAAWRWTGRRWIPILPWTDADLCAVRLLERGDAIIGAVDGRVYRLAGDEVVELAQLGSAVQALEQDASGTLWAAAGGAVVRDPGGAGARYYEPAFMEGGRVHALANEAGVFYAGGAGGVWTLDRGGRWERIPLPLGRSVVYGLAAAGGALYVATGSPRGDGELWCWAGGAARRLIRCKVALVSITVACGRCWAVGADGAIYGCTAEPAAAPRAA